MNTDKKWEEYGKENPYFGVITDDAYRTKNLTETGKEAFFESGAVYVDTVLKKVAHYIEPDFSIKKALDFGCGVGRVVIPLSHHAQEVTGIDVSESMLNEASKNCASRARHNVTLLKSDDSLSALGLDTYDFIHSYIVFQHIPVKRGAQIFENLLSHLEDNGIGVFHFTYSKATKKLQILHGLRKWLPFYTALLNLKNGRKMSEPHRQMNDYNLNKLLSLIQQSGVRTLHVDFTDHAGHFGIILYFKK